jgi:hypothetical protein
MAARSAALVVMVGIGLLVGCLPAAAQSAGKSVSGVLTVSVTVVRSCAVETPSAITAGAGSLADVRLACGRAPSTAKLSSNNLLRVAGVAVPASVSSSKNERGLVVSVDF